MVLFNWNIRARVFVCKTAYTIHTKRISLVLTIYSSNKTTLIRNKILVIRRKLMIFVTDGSHRSVGRVGDITQEPATNEAVNTSEASKIANLLQGLTFPATKEQIKNYIADGKSITISSKSAKITSQFIEDNLQDGKKYNSTYEIERALGLVVKKDVNKDKKRRREVTSTKDKKMEVAPYARDKAMNRANKKRFGEKSRSDPYDIAKSYEEENLK